jgi:hypothetical protein
MIFFGITKIRNINPLILFHKIKMVIVIKIKSIEIGIGI